MDHFAPAVSCLGERIRVPAAAGGDPLRHQRVGQAAVTGEPAEDDLGAESNTDQEEEGGEQGLKS